MGSGFPTATLNEITRIREHFPRTAHSNIDLIFSRSLAELTMNPHLSLQPGQYLLHLLRIEPLAQPVQDCQRCLQALAGLL